MAEKVVLGLSGGVDSAVAAARLRGMGVVACLRCPGENWGRKEALPWT